MRLFVAIFPPAESAEALARTMSSLKISVPQLRWVEPASAHFTLAFLGHVSSEVSDKATEAIRRAASRAAAFNAAFGESGAFDSWERPKIVWLGLSRGAEPMSALAQAVRAELEAEDISFDPKPFVPHLTLGRSKSGRAPSHLKETVTRAIRSDELPSMRVEAIELVSSKTLPSGPVYSVIQREALREA